VRAAARLTREIGERKTRVIELARQAMPEIGTVLSQKLARADLAVLEHYGDPRRLASAGEELLTLITEASTGRGEPTRKADAFRAAARQALELYGDSAAIAFDVLADEIATEIRLLRATENERDRHADAREQAYEQVDPDQLARSLPGLGAIGAPMLVSVLGDPDRFARGSQVKSFTGLTPRASETGETDRKGQPISKAGNRDLRTQLTRSADTARRHDPQLAAVYYDQMVHKGAVHTKALCVVAAKLAERGWRTLQRGSAYQVRDVDDTEVNAEQAKQIIAQRYTVPDHIRAQRRSKKSSGKAPQTGSTRQKRSTRRPSRRPDSPPAAATSNRGEPAA
jgi:transposase